MESALVDKLDFWFRQFCLQMIRSLFKVLSGVPAVQILLLSARNVKYLVGFLPVLSVRVSFVESGDNTKLVLTMCLFLQYPSKEAWELS